MSVRTTTAAALALLCCFASSAEAFRLCARVNSKTGELRAGALKLRQECRAGREVPVELEGGRVVEIYIAPPRPDPIENPDPYCDLDAPLIHASNGLDLCGSIGKRCDFVVDFITRNAYRCDANLDIYMFGGCCR